MRQVGIPVSQGYSEREIGKELGTGTRWVSERLDELRDELRELAG